MSLKIENSRRNDESRPVCIWTFIFGRRVSTQFRVFPISTSVDIYRILHGGAKILLLSSIGENNILRTSVSKILFLTREDKSHIFKPPCNVLFII